jgi:hypothetical protein
MADVTYTREAHAAHCFFTGRPLHDLERWEVQQAWSDPKPAGVPLDAEKDVGFLDQDGAQHVVFTRLAPASERAECPSCQRRFNRQVSL